jgi:hypothetical protein
MDDHGKGEPIVPDAENNPGMMGAGLQARKIPPMAAQRGSDEPFNAGDASGRGGLEPFWPMRYGMMVREPDKAVGNGGKGRVRAMMQ